MGVVLTEDKNNDYKAVLS